MKKFNDFQSLYPVSKTLRFELQPVGATLKHIESNGLLTKDQELAENYQKVKKLIDAYHKHYISQRLLEFSFTPELIETFCELYHNHVDDVRKEMDKCQAALRKEVAKHLTSSEVYKRIDKKELIQTDLIEFLTATDEKCLVEGFHDFTTYFTGFHENRKNMYSDEAQSTAIAYRLVHENLPKFVDNCDIYHKYLAPHLTASIAQINQDLAPQLSGVCAEQMFEIDYFNSVLTQEQIDRYNMVLGGITLDDGTKIKGLNEHINLYNQQQADRKDRLPRVKPLFKQILSDRNSLSWLPEQFASDDDLLNSIKEYYKALKSQLFDAKNDLSNLLRQLSHFDVTKIYITNDRGLSKISKNVYGAWKYIEEALIAKFKQDQPAKNGKETQTYLENIDKLYENTPAYSIAEIDEAMMAYDASKAGQLITYLSALKLKDGQSDIITQIKTNYDIVSQIMNQSYQGNLLQNKSDVQSIKYLLDAINSLLHFIKPLIVQGEGIECDALFYGELTPFYELLSQFTPLYNKVRNYLTRKPYSTEKFKLNFENSTLLNGWDLNKERDNTSVIMRRKELRTFTNRKTNQTETKEIEFYYLAIMDKKHNKVLDASELNKHAYGEGYDKMVYKYFPDPSRMIPKCTTALKEVKEHFGWSDDDYALFNDNFTEKLTIPYEVFQLSQANEGEKKKFQIDYLRQTGDQEGYDHAVRTWIQFCLDFLARYKSSVIYDLSSIKAEQFDSVADFYETIKPILYQISFVPVSADYIDHLVDEGQLYLFRLHNKDFSPYSTGTPNMHTLYWRALFSNDNLQGPTVIKLDGQAEMFFRQKSLQAKVTHKANEPIANKNALNAKKESVFEYDLIKDKRFTMDKFQFHVPITLNFTNQGNERINALMQQYIAVHADDMHIIGIDRGERHLLYLTVIDMRGQIKEQYTLNEIINVYEDNQYRVDYHAELDKKETQRTKARKSWQTIETIKDLKQGYLSQVVHVVSKLIMKYNAIVVLEDLNSGFKQSRQRVEKSVYQQFEKQLIDKLNFLVDKQQAFDADGGVLKAYQLTDKFDSFIKMGKQTGVLFYTPASYTSKIDPVTGFINQFNTRYKNIEKARAFFQAFKSISFNADQGWFEFAFDYRKFTVKNKKAQNDWVICTYGERIPYDVKRKCSLDEINLTDEFKTLFADFGIDISVKDLKTQIEAQESKEFYVRLMKLFGLMVQMRNSVTGTEVDYMISPVVRADGQLYDSRNCDVSLPANADANGAYHIALKGLWVVDQIREAQPDQLPLSNKGLAIKNEDWLIYAQTKPYRK